MTADLAVLTPPLVICVAVLVAVVAFLRHEMGPRRAGDDGDDVAGEGRADEQNHGAARIGDQGKSGTVADSAGETPNEGHAETTGRGSDPRQ